MGILDRFTKKNQEKQLEALEKKPADVQAPKKKNEAAEKGKTSKKSAGATKAKKKSSAPKKTTGRAADALVRPVVSEKAAREEAEGTYTFVVKDTATKIDIKRAIRETYGVQPDSVRVLNMEGKRVRFGRQTGKRKDWKKAMVTLPKGKRIQIHEGV